MDPSAQARAYLAMLRAEGLGALLVIIEPWTSACATGLILTYQTGFMVDTILGLFAPFRPGVGHGAGHRAAS